MIALDFVIFRWLTHADFYNLYKPKGSEASGGGQTYIDFPTSGATLEDWTTFFDGAEEVVKLSAANGPRWEGVVRSIGVPLSASKQSISVYQRRQASIIVASQYLYSSRQNRVRAWHPDYGFPAPANESDREQRPEGLAVFLARAANGQIWAGWYSVNDGEPLPAADEKAKLTLASLFETDASGFLDLRGDGIFLDELNHATPFRSIETKELPTTKAPTTIGPGAIAPPKHISDVKGDYDLTWAYIEEDEITPNGPDEKSYFVAVRKRNTKAVKALKAIYQNMCQVTGSSLLFKKKDGQYYVEVHHLIPLGLGGADNPHNMIVVSPTVHRMLHYADVSGIDLSKFVTNADGSSTLRFFINGEDMTITWHPMHAKLIEANS